MLPKQREEDEGVSSYPDHGGLNSGEDTPMAAVAGMDNASLPRPNRCNQGVAEVEEDTAELLTGWQSRFYGGERARLRRSCSARLRLLRSLQRRRKETKEVKKGWASGSARHAGA